MIRAWSVRDEPKRKCKLNDNTIIEYDACSKNRDAYDPNVFSYIGAGSIYSINDVKQEGFNCYYFFKRK